MCTNQKPLCVASSVDFLSMVFACLCFSCLSLVSIFADFIRKVRASIELGEGRAKCVRANPAPRARAIYVRVCDGKIAE